MTSRPRLATDVNFVNGLAALALFLVLAYVFVTSALPAPSGFPDGSITASIGFAMFGLLDQAPVPAENFLVAFEIIDVVLVAALVGGVMLARREEDGSVVTALTDGGRRLAGRGGSEANDSGVAEADADNSVAAAESATGDADADGPDQGGEH